MLTYHRYGYRPLRLSRALTSLFDDSVVNPQWLSPVSAVLPLDIQSTADGYVIKANVPGLSADKLHLEVLGDTVTIRGEVDEPEEQAEGEWLLRERRFGKFHRTLTLPSEVDGGAAEAAIENGVLTIRLPKAEAARAKTIKVMAR